MHRIILTILVFMFGLTVSPANSEEQNDGPARKLINSQGCKACHTLEGDGGTVAGSFEDMREKLTRSEVLSQLVNPEQKHGNSTIPDFSHLSDKEIDALVDFIQPNQ
jgi:mono/diheme cytochrome c family protein